MVSGRSWAAAGQLLEGTGGGGNLTSDVHLAALATERRTAVCTVDRDFTRLGVEVVEPG